MAKKKKLPNPFQKSKPFGSKVPAKAQKAPTKRRKVDAARFGPSGPKASLEAIDRAKAKARKGKSLPFSNEVTSAPSRTENRPTPQPIKTTSDPDTIPVNTSIGGGQDTSLSGSVGRFLNKPLVESEPGLTPGSLLEVAQTIPGLGVVGGIGGVQQGVKAGFSAADNAAKRNAFIQLSKLSPKEVASLDFTNLLKAGKSLQKSADFGAETFARQGMNLEGIVTSSSGILKEVVKTKPAWNTKTARLGVKALQKMSTTKKYGLAIAGILAFAASGFTAVTTATFLASQTQDDETDTISDVNFAIAEQERNENWEEVDELLLFGKEMEDSIDEADGFLDNFNTWKAGKRKLKADLKIMEVLRESTLKNREKAAAEAEKPTFAEEREAQLDAERERELREQAEDDARFDEREKERQDRKDRIQKDLEDRFDKRQKERNEERLRQIERENELFKKFQAQNKKKGGETDFEKFKKSQLGFGLIR